MTNPYIFVVGNEKGGAGKTTCAMHLITGLLERGLRVASLDTDCRQHSLTRYIQNRENYNAKNTDKMIKIQRTFESLFQLLFEDFAIKLQFKILPKN